MKKLKSTALVLSILMLPGMAPTALAAENIAANPSSHQVYVDNRPVEVTAYNISGNNYFRLRDIGRLVDFAVSYDNSTRTVSIASNSHYVPEPGESSVLKNTARKGAAAALTSQKIQVNGELVSPTVYIIDGSNFFKLRDLGELIDFGVAYDAETRSVSIRTDLPYSPDATPSAGTAKTSWDKTMWEFHNAMVACNWNKPQYLTVVKNYAPQITGKSNGTAEDVIAVPEQIQNAPVDASSMDDNPVNMFWADELRKAIGETPQHSTSHTDGRAAPELATDEMFRKWETEMINAINSERRKIGRPEVPATEAAMGFARYWAKEMSVSEFKHSSYTETIEYANKYGISKDEIDGLENISRGGLFTGPDNNPVPSIMEAFMKSDGHRASLLHKDVHKIGVGFAISDKGTIFCCQTLAF